MTQVKRPKWSIARVQVQRRRKKGRKKPAGPRAKGNRNVSKASRTAGLTPDGELILRCLAKEPDAVKLLAVRVTKKAYSIARSKLDSEAERKDLCQDVTMKVFMHLSDFDIRRDLDPWVATIARNASNDRLRALARSRELARRLSPPDSVPSGQPQVLSLARRRFVALTDHRVQSVIKDLRRSGKLSEVAWMTLNLQFEAQLKGVELPDTEIARMTGYKSAGAVKVTRHRAWSLIVASLAARGLWERDNLSSRAAAGSEGGIERD